MKSQTLILYEKREFISYNLSYPIESTKFAFQNRIESNGFTFLFVGKNAKAPIFFESTQLKSKEEVKQWVRKKERFLRKEIQKAYETVYNDLDGDPSPLWYNDIKTTHISKEVLENLSQHITHQIVIITNGTKLDGNGQFQISSIELPISTTSQTFVKTPPLYG